MLVGGARLAVLAPTPSIFVDVTNGIDARSGIGPGVAIQTITKANSLTYRQRAKILFKGGATISGALALTLTNCPAGNVTVGSYGTGQATITSTTSAAVTATNVPSVTVDGLICTGGGNATNTTAGISIVNSLGGDTRILGPKISNCTVTQYGGNGIEVKGTSGFAGFNSVLISSCTVHDCTGQVTGGISGFLQGTAGINVFSYTGFAGGQGGTNPSHRDVVISSCTVYNVNGVAGAGSWTGSGITVFQTAGGQITNCLAHDFGANVDGGHGAGAIWIGDCDSYAIRYCEAYNGRHGVGGFDGGAYDLDEGCTNCVIEYNWAHDNQGYGILLDANVDGSLNLWGGNTVRWNICQNNQAELCIAATGDMTSVSYVHNNTFYAAPGGNSVLRAGTSVAIVTLSNNLFYVAKVGDTVISISTPSSINFTQNCYYSQQNGSVAAINFTWNGSTYASFAAWQTASTQEKISGSNVGITVDPKIYVPGGGFTTAGYFPAQMMAYNLQSTSTMGTAGLNLTTQYSINPGPTDYYGNAVVASALPVGVSSGDIALFAASSTAASTFLARVSSFSTLDQVNYNSLLSGLNSDGTLSLIDILYVMAAPNSAGSLLNLMSSSFSLVSNGTTTFTARQGILGNGSTGYLNTGWVPSTNGVNFALTSACHSFYGLTNGLSDAKADYGLMNSGHTSETSSYSGTGGYYADVNDFSGNTDATTSSNGCFMMNRSGTTLKNWVNGANTGTRTISAVALPNQNLIALASNKGTGAGIVAADFKASQMAALMFGSGSIDAAAWARRINSFMQAYGINTY